MGLFLALCANAQDTPVPEPAVVRAARENLEQVKRLAAAGAASKRQLSAAENALQQALDDNVLARTLDAEIAVEDLTEQQSSEMTAAARRRLEREQERLAGHAKLVAEGVAPRTSLAPFEEEVARARRMVDAAEERARSLAEIAAMIRAEQEAEIAPETVVASAGPLPRVVRFVGRNQFHPSDFRRVVLAFEKAFERKLPVSAKGETALHRSLGFDHRGRIDVAVNPDQPEGRWLQDFLQKEKIPFFAFRSFVAGQATGPHIHIGPPSLKLRASD